MTVSLAFDGADLGTARGEEKALARRCDVVPEITLRDARARFESALPTAG